MFRILLLLVVAAALKTMATPMRPTLASPPPSVAAETLEERLNAILLSKNFSVANYLNLALEDNDDPERLAQVALRLQLQTQSAHEDISKISAELQAIMPRCAADIGRLKVGWEGLSQDCQSMLEATTQETTSAVTTESLQTLSTLHALQTNLQETREILTAATQWDTTLAQIAPLLAQQQWEAAVQALAQLQQGERALQGMPQADERKQSCEKLQAQLLALLQPQLVSALQQSRPLQQWVSWYTQLGQIAILEQLYTQSRPKALQKAWFDGSSENFVVWWPTWLSQVNDWLAHERRQSVLPDGIVWKVWSELMRPLSLENRLDGLELAELATCYQALLEFLSVAYDTVVGEEGLADPEPLLRVVKLMTGPFAKYQRNLPALEQEYVRLPTIELGERDLSATWYTLVPSFIPCFKGTLSRLELLNGGYQATQVLGVMDPLIAQYANSIANALRQHVTEFGEFDDAQVPWSMQALVVAGSFLRDLQVFEDEVKEQLKVLSQRMGKAINDPLVLTDSWSPVEVDSFVTKFVAEDSLGSDEVTASLAVIQRLTTVVTLFPEARDAVQRLMEASQSVVLNVCSSVPRSAVAGMSSMTVWKETQNVDTGYGVLPQSFMTQVGEHMLALVQAIEPFAADQEMLHVGNLAMQNVSHAAVHSWRDLLVVIGSTHGERLTSLWMDSKHIGSYVAQNSFDEEEHDDDIDASMQFCNHWLNAIALYVTGRVLERVMKIPSLSSKGSEQLNADLGYLVNVLAALGVAGQPHPLLVHFAALSTMDSASLTECMERRDKNDPAQSALRMAEEKFGAIRALF